MCGASVFAQQQSTPLIPEPRLTYVNTNNGLDQDTINDIYVDKEGFTWFATDEGLNRFDGSSVYKVHGSKNELSSIPIYKVLEHSSGLFYLATDNDGILSFDKYTHEVNVVLQLPYRNQTQWIQYPVSWKEYSNGDLLFAVDESVYRYAPSTQKLDTLFTLSTQEIESGKFIRSMLKVRDTLLVGTNFGLTAVNLNNNKEMSILGNAEIDENQFNTKLLFTHEEKYLYVGTVEGLYRYSLGELLNHINGSWEKPSPLTVIAHRNIWDVTITNEGTAFLGTDLGLFTLNLNTLEFDFLLKPVRGYDVLSSTQIKNVAIDNNQNVWLGTQLSGAMLWSPKTLLFTNVRNSLFTELPQQLSSNTIYGMYQYDANSLFVGTENGLNKYNTDTGAIERYEVETGVRAQYSDSSILKIDSVERGYLWVNTNDGMRYFSLSEGKYVRLPIKSPEVLTVFDQYIYSFYIENNTYMWLMSIDSIYRVNLKNEKLISIDFTDSPLPLKLAEYFIGKDPRTNSILIASSAQLWGLNAETFEISLLHSVKHKNVKSSIAPTEFLTTSHDKSYLVYAGLGMFEIDNTQNLANAYDGKFLDTSVLPTSLIYGLSEGKNGNLWFASHSGLHAYDPRSGTTKSFGLSHGLASSEYNLDASINLSDGRLVFGGNLGFTIFNPDEIIDNYTLVEPKAVITEVEISSRELMFPLSNLNGSTFELNHDDIGLSVYFSDLNSDAELGNKFAYRIKSKGEVTNFPGASINKLVLPSLPSGNHVIEVYPVLNDTEKSVARIYINVAYPLFLSPIAYLVYVFMFMLVSFYLYQRRRRVQLILETANQQVSQYNRRLTDALLASNANIWEYSSATGLIRCDRICNELKGEATELGKEDSVSQSEHRDEIQHQDYVKFIHENDKQNYLSVWRAFLSKEEQSFDVTYRVINSAGDTLWYRDVGSLNETNSGIIEVKGTYSNITSTVAAQDKLKLFGNAFKHTRDWVLIFNKNKELVATNPALNKVFGVHDSDSMKANRDKLLSQYQAKLNEITSRLNGMKPGQRLKTESTIDIHGKLVHLQTDYNAVAESSFPDVIDFYLIISRDITEQANAQKELQKLANYDVLTGLINRNLLLERLKQSIHFSHRHNTQLAALFIDLDRFKPINDSFGHLSGDKVLSETAERLRVFFKEQTTVARIGGDEFVVIIEEIEDWDALAQTMTELMVKLELPISIGTQNVSISASIGISVFPDDATDAEHLIRNADIAMFAAKEQGKNRYQFFTQKMNDNVQSNTILQNRVKAAHSNNEFVNYYQAIVDIETGETAGFEMLMRWFDDGHFISPAEFIPVAEQVGCIVGMTMRGINKAIQDISMWYAKGFSGYVAINLSARQFTKRPDFELIIKWLNDYQLPTSCIRFEITEGLLVSNDERTLDYMDEMRKLGFKIALDDFGTGYSSLKYLKDFPLDVLKIDRSFVQDMMADKGTESIVRSTLIMTELLELDTVAEGVETQEELAYFLEHKCRYVQGFYFAKPSPAEQVEELLFKNWMSSK
jgi:diguanylate cyclase (GGDEF)-like protein